jgi:predicted nucleotidyltransferase
MRVNRQAIDSLRCPRRTAEEMGSFAERVANVLVSHIVGAYAYGSLARGCFHEATSDVDLMVICEAACADREVAEIVRASQDVAIPIDAVFVSKSQVDSNEVPTLVDFRIKPTGNLVRSAEGSRDFVIDRQDVHECGLALVGPAPAAVIGPVPWAALREALDWLFPHILSHFKNPALMLCRIAYAFANRRLCSKAAAGQWARQEFGPRWQPLIEAGLRDYAEGRRSTEEPGELLRSFERYCAGYIARARSRR